MNEQELDLNRKSIEDLKRLIRHLEKNIFLGAADTHIVVALESLTGIVESLVADAEARSQSTQVE